MSYCTILQPCSLELPPSFRHFASFASPRRLRIMWRLETPCPATRDARRPAPGQPIHPSTLPARAPQRRGIVGGFWHASSRGELLCPEGFMNPWPWQFMNPYSTSKRTLTISHQSKTLWPWTRHRGGHRLWPVRAFEVGDAAPSGVQALAGHRCGAERKR